MKAEENERLVRVGPGTPAGDLFRRYWQPAVLSSELLEPDGAPVRVRLLGENLLAFRDSEGKVGLVDAFCPHRRAPLFYGRNEECGIRCVYHGWKFDRHGTCTDLPTEPPGSAMQNRVRLKAYPTHEAGGVVWAYLGPREKQPEPPDYEWLRPMPSHLHVSKTFENCNYLQALEGGLDTAHVSFLHRGPGNAVTELASRDIRPKLDVCPTAYGYYYTSERQIDDAHAYLRIYQYMMPAQQVRPSLVETDGSRRKTPVLDGHLWVPIDDETTYVYNFIYGSDADAALSEQYVRQKEAFFGRSDDDLIPGTFRLKKNASNDYMVDRALQAKGNFSGITGVNTQDFALQEGMGPIVDRSGEALGSTDRAIITMRRMMLEAIRGLKDEDRDPPGVHPNDYRTARAHEAVIPKDASRDDVVRAAVAKW